MTVYVLINGQTQTFLNPQIIVPVNTDGPIPQNVIAPEQSFQLTVTGNPGVTVSATAQVVASNDRVNWTPYFDPVSVTGQTTATAGWGGSQNWKYFSAYLTAISGLGAKATLTMNG